MKDNEATVLVVEDDLESARMLARLFAGSYRVLHAEDAEQALEMAVAAQPDAIVLDIILPGMDGFACCERLKSDPRTAQIPVVFMTGIDRGDAENRGLNLGAADFVAKPINPVVLQKRVQIQVDLKRARDQLTLLAATDGLTGLANRRQFDEALAREYARLARSRHELSVLLADIDHFKPYNDRYGHVRGDECLQSVARAIASAAFRPADLAARYGGEEFACILPETSPVGAMVIAERIRAAIAELAIPHVDTPSGTVTVSIGIASEHCLPGGSGSGLVMRADAQLYRAKSEGRDLIVGDAPA
jgi:diguanylate cyclase (GGDEF)-like protein